MSRKKQIVSINFMGNLVFIGWKLNPGQGWCIVRGRTCWNSTRFVSQTCLTSQSQKHTCAHRPATATQCIESWVLLPLSVGFPSQLFYSRGPTWSHSARCGSGAPFVCISCRLPGLAHLLWIVSWTSALFSVLSPHTCVSIRESLGSTSQTANILLSACYDYEPHLVPLHPEQWHIISLPKCCFHYVISFLRDIKWLSVSFQHESDLFRLDVKPFSQSDSILLESTPKVPLALLRSDSASMFHS